MKKHIAQNPAKTAWRQSFREMRKAQAKDCKAFCRSIKAQTEIALAKLASLCRQVESETAKARADMRETDNFINSGKSLIAFANNRGRF